MLLRIAGNPERFSTETDIIEYIRKKERSTEAIAPNITNPSAPISDNGLPPEAYRLYTLPSKASPTGRKIIRAERKRVQAISFHFSLIELITSATPTRA